MTPSTGVMNYLAKKSKKHNIVVEQAEDEISAHQYGDRGIICRSKSHDREFRRRFRADGRGDISRCHDGDPDSYSISPKARPRHGVTDQNRAG